MTDEPTREPKSLDLTGMMAALKRAAQRAREEAVRTHTDLILMRNGKIERVSPSDDTKPAELG